MIRDEQGQDELYSHGPKNSSRPLGSASTLSMKRQGSLSVEERSSGDGISSFTLLHMYTCYIVYAIDKKEAMRSGMTQIRYLGIIFCSTLQSVRYERRLCEIRERVPNPGRMYLVSPSDISRIDVPAAKKARTQKQRGCSDTWCDDLER